MTRQTRITALTAILQKHKIKIEVSRHYRKVKTRACNSPPDEKGVALCILAV